jgi:transcription initiation factor TFIID subunit 6
MSNTNPTRKILLGLVEEHITGVVREAFSIARKCKRARLNGTRIHASDVNLALEISGSEKLYATPVVPPDRVQHAKILLEDVLKEEIPAAPSEIVMQQSWLCVNGEDTLQPSESESQEASRLTSSNLRVNQLQSGLLSEELKLYFERVTAVMQRGGATYIDRNQQDTVLQSLAKDSGLQELVPFLVRYAQQQLHTHVHNTDHCHTIIRLIRALLHNPGIHLELHLHELLPVLMTCVVARKLEGPHHWDLRREAGCALAECCVIFTEYSTLRSRILKSLCDGLATTTSSSSSSLASKYGGILAISLFGTRAVESFILPVVPLFWSQWQSELDQIEFDIEKTTELHMCQQAILIAMTKLLRGSCDTSELLADLEDDLGDRLVAMHGLENNYNTCFI